MTESLGETAEINYQAVAEALQKELEMARIEILRLRFSKTVHVDLDALTAYLNRHYVLIAVAAIGIGLLFNLADLLKGRNKHA